MTTISASAAAPTDPFSTLARELEGELGTGDGAGLAAYFVEAERADFYWQARLGERPLGAYQGFEDDGETALERVAVSGFFAGRWFVATCLVDGAGAVHDLMDLMRFEHEIEAQAAFVHAH